MIRFWDPSREYLEHKEEFDQAIQGVLTRGDLILRDDVEKFEKRFAEFVGTKYCVGLSSGTDAIYISLKALGVKGKVALPSYTFKATCGAVVNAGCEPVLYDMGGSDEHPSSYDLDAFIVAHISGELEDTPIPLNYAMPVIEDACQAIGAVKNPTSDVQCWSFYPAKILGCFGDAGAITTNRQDVYEYIKEARNHFKTDNRDFGGNHRMDNLQAAVLNVKLNYIDKILARRKEIAERYLKELKFGLPNNQPGRVWQDFIIRVPNGEISWEESKKYGIYPAHKRRDDLYEYLKENGIETLKNEYPFSPEYPKLPLTAKYEAETLRIPLYYGLKDSEVEQIIISLQKYE